MRQACQRGMRTEARGPLVTRTRRFSARSSVPALVQLQCGNKGKNERPRVAQWRRGEGKPAAVLRHP